MTTPTDYNLDFIGKEDDLNQEEIYKTFDINYVNLNTLPVNYYPIYNNKFLDFLKKQLNFTGQDITNDNVKAEIKKVIDNMNLSINIYNRYLILPITIMIVIIWIFVLLFVLKYIHINYNIYYLYIIIAIIIALLIFGSVWFLYVNSQLL